MGGEGLSWRGYLSFGIGGDYKWGEPLKAPTFFRGTSVLNLFLYARRREYGIWHRDFYIRRLVIEDDCPYP